MKAKLGKQLDNGHEMKPYIKSLYVRIKGKPVKNIRVIL